jgi:hypothetical protein
MAVYLRQRQIHLAAEIEESRLELTAGELFAGVVVGDCVSQPCNPPAAATAAEELVHLREIEMALHFGLLHRIAKLPIRNDRRKVEQRAGDGRAGNAIHRSAIGRSQRTVAVGVDSGWDPSPPTWRGDVNAITAVFPQPPECRCRSMRKNRFWPAGEYRRHAMPVRAEQGMAHRENALMNPVHPADIHPPFNERLIKPEADELP